MIEELATIIKDKIEADPVLGVWVNGTDPIPVHLVGNRIDVTPEAPFIRLSIDDGERIVHTGQVTLTFEVFDTTGGVARKTVAARLKALFQFKRLATTGLAVSRLCQRYFSDGHIDRPVGDFKLVMMFTGLAVTDPRYF